MFHLLRLQALTLSLFGLSCASALALDEVEPNDDIGSANDASRTSVIRGVIEPGANTRYDYFRISPFFTYQYNLHAEVRILTGPHAGSENFGFFLQAVSPPPYSSSPLYPNSFGSGNGSRVIRLEPGLPPYASLHLRAEFPPHISDGTYEIRYALVRDASRTDVPSLKTETRRAPGSDQVIVKINARTRWGSIMHRLTARATGHKKATVVSNYFGTKYINLPQGPDYLSSNAFEMLYQIDLQRPVTRLVIFAEDSGGLKSRETLVFRRKSASLGPSRFPRVD